MPTFTDPYSGATYKFQPKRDAPVTITIPFPGPEGDWNKNPSFTLSFRRCHLDELCRFHRLDPIITCLWNMLAGIPQDRKQFSRLRKRRRTEVQHVPARGPSPREAVAWGRDPWPTIPIRIAFDKEEAELMRRWLGAPGNLTRLRAIVQEWVLRDEMLERIRRPPRGRTWKTGEVNKVLAASLFFARELIVQAQSGRRLEREIKDLLVGHAAPRGYLIEFGGLSGLAKAVALVIHGMAGAKPKPRLADLAPDEVFRRHLYGPPRESLSQTIKTQKDFDRKYSLKMWESTRKHWQDRLLADRPGQIARDFFLT